MSQSADVQTGDIHWSEKSDGSAAVRGRGAWWHQACRAVMVCWHEQHKPCIRTHLAEAGALAARGTEPLPAVCGDGAGGWGAACCVPTDASELTAAVLPSDAPCNAGLATACRQANNSILA